MGAGLQPMITTGLQQCSEHHRQRVRITLAALNCLERITEEVNLNRDDFPDADALDISQHFNTQVP